MTTANKNLGSIATIQPLEARRFFTASPYTLTPLQSDTGFTTDSVAINQTWQVLGGERSPGVWQLCPCNKIRFTPLGTAGLSGADPRSINALSTVAGQANFAADPGDAHAAIWRPVKRQGYVPTDLGVLPGGDESHGRDVNDAGLVVGYSDVGGGVDHAFLSVPGKKGRMTMLDLNARRPAGSTYLLDSASGINNTNQIIGLGRTGNGPYSSFFMQLVGKSSSTVTEVGGLPYKYGPTSRLRDLNDNGQAVGFSKTNDSYHGFEEHALLATFKNGVQTLTDLNPGGDVSHAFDINNKGQIVGEFQPAGSTSFRGFLYTTTKSGRAVFIDLNTMVPAGSGWTITAATGINEKGEITALGTDSQGHDRALLLLPRVAQGAAPAVAKTAATPFAATTRPVTTFSTVQVKPENENWLATPVA